MTEDDFHTKEHITKHLTGAQYNLIRERSRVNSADEQAFLNWAEFIARTLRTNTLSPFCYKLYMIGETNLYRRSHGSFKFGAIGKLANKRIWIIIAVIGIVAAVVYFGGFLNF